MIVSIMQPYLLPYVGYFQLIAASDVFVVYDDVQYMKGGWINRNRVLLAGQPQWLTLPVARAPVETPINRMLYAGDGGKARRLLAAAYAKAPRYGESGPLLDALLADAEPNVARFNENGLRTVCDALGIGTRFVRSSQIGRDTGLGGQAAVIDIARRLGARRYLNAIGGTGLYDAGSFAAQGLELAFIRPRPEPYPQFGGAHVPNLSIADLMMFCDAARLAEQLSAYDLVTA